MQRFALRALPLLALLLLGARPGLAQDGFAFKLGAVFNASTAQESQTDLRASDASGWSIGAEYLLPLGIGLGVSGYTAGSPDDFDFSQGSLLMLADANYFLRFPLLPIAPYAGLHIGLGTYTMEDVQNAAQPEVDFGDLGYQLGVRVQPTARFGIDAQFRQVSGSLRGEQDSSFEARQFLLGVTLF